jgi:GT2 family glycosyltransferase
MSCASKAYVASGVRLDSIATPGEQRMVEPATSLESATLQGQVGPSRVQQPKASSRSASLDGDGAGCPGTISVIVPVHQDSPLFQRCLGSIRAALRPDDEVIVVVDGVSDGPAQVAAQFGMRVVKTGARRGPAAARNLGAQLARGEFLFFTDADVAVPETILHQVVEAFQEHPEASAVIGSYDDCPSEANLLSQYKNLLHHFVHQRAQEEGYTFWGAGSAVRRAVFLELGGYDERYRQPSIEDIELGYRLRAAGHRIFVCKTLQVKHLKRWTAARLFKSDFFHRALPWTELILGTGSFENDLNISRSNRIKVALAFCLLGVLGVAWSWPPALVAGMVFGLLLLAMDAPLLRFFQQKRGLWFALGTIPWHWFHYTYSGVAFGYGLILHLLGGRGRRQQKLAGRGSGVRKQPAGHPNP